MSDNQSIARQESGSGHGRDEQGTQADRDVQSLLPPVDVIEDAGGITLYADLPGVPKDKLDIRVESETLLIQGDVALAISSEMSPTHAEVPVQRYRRTFTLSKELDASAVDAAFDQGVLRLRIPKAKDAQPRRIQVAVH